jgi:hypothetical protein
MNRLEEYSDTDILNALKNIIPKQRTRKRTYIDKRNYLISILHYKFQYTEEKIANMFSLTSDPLNRSSINHAKKQPGYYSKNEDTNFLVNTGELAEKFPFNIPEKYTEGIEKNLHIPMSIKQHRRIVNYCEKHTLRQNQAIRKLLDSALKIDETNYTVKLVRE